MRVNKTKDCIVVVLSVHELSRSEIKWAMSKGWISVHEAKEELKRRGEDEWKALVELRKAI